MRLCSIAAACRNTTRAIRLDGALSYFASQGAGVSSVALFSSRVTPRTLQPARRTGDETGSPDAFDLAWKSRSSYADAPRSIARELSRRANRSHATCSI